MCRFAHAIFICAVVRLLSKRWEKSASKASNVSWQSQGEVQAGMSEGAAEWLSDVQPDADAHLHSFPVASHSCLPERSRSFPGLTDQFSTCERLKPDAAIGHRLCLLHRCKRRGQSRGAGGHQRGRLGAGLPQGSASDVSASCKGHLRR